MTIDHSILKLSKIPAPLVFLIQNKLVIFDSSTVVSSVDLKYR